MCKSAEISLQANFQQPLKLLLKSKMMEQIGRTYFFYPLLYLIVKKTIRSGKIMFFRNKISCYTIAVEHKKMDQFSCRPSGTFDSNCALETAPTRSWNEQKKMWTCFRRGFKGGWSFFFCLSSTLGGGFLAPDLLWLRNCMLLMLQKVACKSWPANLLIGLAVMVRVPECSINPPCPIF